MDVNERYRAAARRLLKQTDLKVEVHATVSTLNPRQRGDVGEGAFVEVSVFVPVSALGLEK